MIDLGGGKEWKTLADQIFIGGHVIEAIYKGSIKIYPIGSKLFKAYMPCIVSYNGCIHVFGGFVVDDEGHTSEYSYYHIKWDGTTWSYVGRIPDHMTNEQAVVYNGTIYALGGDNNYNVYKYDDSGWSLVSNRNDMPQYGYNYSTNIPPLSLCTIGGSLYMIAKYQANSFAILDWNGSKWNWINHQSPFVPKPNIYMWEYGKVFSISHDIVHLFYSTYSESQKITHVTWRGGDGVTSQDQIPNRVYVNLNPLYFFVNNGTVYYLYFNDLYYLNSNGSWVKHSSIPFDDTFTVAVFGTSYRGEIHAFNSNDGSHWKYSEQDSAWVRLPDVMI